MTQHSSVVWCACPSLFAPSSCDPILGCPKKTEGVRLACAPSTGPTRRPKSGPVEEEQSKKKKSRLHRRFGIGKNRAQFEIDMAEKILLSHYDEMQKSDFPLSTKAPRVCRLKRRQDKRRMKHDKVKSVGHVLINRQILEKRSSLANLGGGTFKLLLFCLFYSPV